MTTHEKQSYSELLLATDGRLSTLARIDLVDRLRRRARAYQRLAVIACDRTFTSRDKARKSTLRAELEGLIEGMYPGAEVDLTGDPRGYTVKITHPRLPANELGGAFGVA